MSFRRRFEPRATYIASEIATQRDYEYLVSASIVSCCETGIPVSNRTKPFFPRVICRFFGCWQPDVCHEAAPEMSLSDEGNVIDSGSAVGLDKPFGLYYHVVPRP